MKLFEDFITILKTNTRNKQKIEDLVHAITELYKESKKSESNSRWIDTFSSSWVNDSCCQILFFNSRDNVSFYSCLLIYNEPSKNNIKRTFDFILVCKQFEIYDKLDKTFFFYIMNIINPNVPKSFRFDNREIAIDYIDKYISKLNTEDYETFVNMKKYNL